MKKLALLLLLASCSRPAEQVPPPPRLEPAIPAKTIPPAWLASMKVAWHPSVEEAAAAARRSGKGLLVFDLLGRLDEEHC